MIKSTCIVTMLLFIISIVNAQTTKPIETETKEPSAAKSIFFEVGSPGIASINYEMRLNKKQDGLGFRIGLGGATISGEGFLSIPLGFTYLMGGNDKKNFFELGAGYTILGVYSEDYVFNPATGTSSYQKTKSFKSSFPHIYFGYRYQPKNSGFLFRAGIAPIFVENSFVPYIPSLSLGYKF